MSCACVVTTSSCCTSYTQKATASLYTLGDVTTTTTTTASLYTLSDVTTTSTTTASLYTLGDVTTTTTTTTASLYILNDVTTTMTTSSLYTHSVTSPPPTRAYNNVVTQQEYGSGYGFPMTTTITATHWYAHVDSPCSLLTHQSCVRFVSASLWDIVTAETVRRRKNWLISDTSTSPKHSITQNTRGRI
ncbi:hypothetical protein E2C01_043907 [Portunus trituberculatus]|uniref:Uncharacterized protein n=1 Tax=Portunus trituberculatus TaxID=210409 RepID=A0A5B7FXM5_PORTR|nr:hypothetical protein [Portunus trituberculatus]